MESLEELKSETKYIKVEVFETEDNAIINNELVQHYMSDKLKIENTGSDLRVSKCESEECDEIFPDKFSLEIHSDKCHNNKSNEEPNSTTTVKQNEEYSDFSWLECSYSECGKVYKNIETLRKHIIKFHRHDRNDEYDRSLKSKTKQNKRLYRCQHPNCGKYFKKIRMYNSHITVHVSGASFKCKKVGCTESFESNRALNAHFKVHSGKRPFKCSNCNLSFKAKDCLKAHIGEHHREVSSEDAATLCEEQGKMILFKCEYPNCDKTFVNIHNLKDHALSHTNVRNFKCIQMGCEMFFKRKRDLVRHAQVHSDEKPFQCSYPNCGKRFKSDRCLKCHSIVHSEEAPFKCLHVGCSKEFTRKSGLKSHERIMHSVGFEKLRCDYSFCRATFLVKSSYNKHMRVHLAKQKQEKFTKTVKSCKSSDVSSECHQVEKSSGMRNTYQCSVCGFLFRKKKYFDWHVKRCVKREFVDIDEVKTKDLFVDVKLENENKD